MEEQRRAFTPSGRGLADPALNLAIVPGRTMEPAEFCRLVGPAIGLDGVVSGPPFRHRGGRGVRGPKASFDHHESVDRTSTRACCEQVHLEVGRGLWRLMRRDGRPGADVYVNDADEDVCTSMWVLAHPRRLNEPIVRQLVHSEGIIDALACTWWPEWLDLEDGLPRLAWVYGPCHDARRNAALVDAESLRRLIEEVAERITAYVDGRGGRRPVDDSYEVVHRDGPVAVIREIGPFARGAACRDGFEVVISERWAGEVRVVSITKPSSWSPCDLTEVYRALNQAEGCPPDDEWGGSDLVGGSPRRGGTRLSSEEILETVVRCLATAGATAG